MFQSDLIFLILNILKFVSVIAAKVIENWNHVKYLSILEEINGR